MGMSVFLLFILLGTLCSTTLSQFSFRTATLQSSFPSSSTSSFTSSSSFPSSSSNLSSLLTSNGNSGFTTTGNGFSTNNGFSTFLTSGNSGFSVPNFSSTNNGFSSLASTGSLANSSTVSYAAAPAPRPVASAPKANNYPTWPDQDYPPVINTYGRDTVFDGNIRKFNIEISRENDYYMNLDPRDELYVPCSITTDYGTPELEQKWEGTGCAYKGSVGSLYTCVDPTTAAKIPTCRKLSLKVDSNKFRNDKQKVNEIKKYVFNAMGHDDSLVSERIAYTLLNECGIPAPRSSYALVYINGEYSGLYAMIEPIDKQLTKRLFKDDPTDVNEGKGGIYKDIWFTENYQPSTKEYFESFHSDGKEEEEFLTSLSAVVNSFGDDEAEFLFENFFDAQSIVDITAFNNLIGQTDDWRHRHNFKYYVKELPSGSKILQMIPWDYDRINDVPDGRGVQKGLEWDQLLHPENMKCDVEFDTLEEKAADTARKAGNTYEWWLGLYKFLPIDVGIAVQCENFWRLVLIALRDRIHDRTLDFATTCMTPDKIASVMNKYSAQIEPYVKIDPDPPTVEQWNAGKQDLYNYIYDSLSKAVTESMDRAPLNLVPDKGTTAAFNTAIQSRLAAATRG